MAHRRAVQPLLRQLSPRTVSTQAAAGLLATCIAAKRPALHINRTSRNQQQQQLLSTTASNRSVYDDFRNILDDAERPPVIVDTCTETTFKLTDGIILPSNCIFHNGAAFMWDVPPAAFDWRGWSEDMFQLFEFTSPKPDVLLFGTGKNTLPPPPFLRPYLNSLGIQLDVMDSRNACATFNLLAEEGRRVAAAVLTLTPIDSRSGAPIA